MNLFLSADSISLQFHESRFHSDKSKEVYRHICNGIYLPGEYSFWWLPLLCLNQVWNGILPHQWAVTFNFSCVSWLHQRWLPWVFIRVRGNGGGNAALTPDLLEQLADPELNEWDWAPFSSARWNRRLLYWHICKARMDWWRTEHFLTGFLSDCCYVSFVLETCCIFQI